MATRKQRFENIRLNVNYNICESPKYRPGERGTYAKEMVPHVETNGELILGGTNMTPSEHLAEFLNRTLSLRQTVVRVETNGHGLYDILVENHA